MILGVITDFRRFRLVPAANNAPSTPVIQLGGRNGVFAVVTTSLTRQQTLPVAENHAVLGRIGERSTTVYAFVRQPAFHRQLGERDENPIA